MTAKRLISSNFIRAIVKPPLELSLVYCAVCTSLICSVLRRQKKIPRYFFWLAGIHEVFQEFKIFCLIKIVAYSKNDTKLNLHKCKRTAKAPWSFCYSPYFIESNKPVLARTLIWMYKLALCDG